ncbi:MAG TPA: DinB family protein [Blastocatellia bacterium]|nr:DinB family protein [Blastocatellia bacterium]
MSTITRPEPWLCGPLADVSRLTMPAAHALLQSRGDLETHGAALTIAEVWAEPGRAPSVGFHLRHLAGSIDRLLAYTAGRGLTDEQFRDLASERMPGEPPAGAAQLVAAAQARIDEALEVIRSTPDERLFEPRAVGRAQLPTNVWGLLFHIAEHTQRHTGQLIATASVVRGSFI